jgi:hypothetical protein
VITSLSILNRINIDSSGRSRDDEILYNIDSLLITDRGDQIASLRTQIIEQIATLMTAAFAFVAALQWNTAIKAIIDKYIALGDAWIWLVVTAIIVTIIAVIASLIIARAAAKARSLDAKAGK